MEFLSPLPSDGVDSHAATGHHNTESSVARFGDPATRMKFVFFSSQSRDVVDQHARRYTEVLTEYELYISFKRGITREKLTFVLQNPDLFQVEQTIHQ